MSVSVWLAILVCVLYDTKVIKMVGFQFLE